MFRQLVSIFMIFGEFAKTWSIAERSLDINVVATKLQSSLSMGWGNQNWKKHEIFVHTPNLLEGHRWRMEAGGRRAGRWGTTHGISRCARVSKEGPC